MSSIRRLAGLRPRWPSRLPEGARPGVDLVRLVSLWAFWLVIICAFQIVVAARVAPQRPDQVLSWTPNETSDLYLTCRPMLDDPAMNEHVAFDSEYYISIATGGYDDPNAAAYASGGFTGRWSGVPSCGGAPAEWTSLNHAFLPGYPTAMQAVIAVLKPLPFASDLTDVGRATLAGIIVSALGGLLAMLGLARLWAYIERRRKGSNADSAESGAWGGSGGLRAALYLLVFPTGFYLAQVYTEGLFIGLAFMACAMAVERKIFAGAVLAALATLVRPGGAFLVLPLAWASFEIIREAMAARTDKPLNWRLAEPALLPLAPVVAFLAWYNSSLGQSWRAVEDGFFGRHFDLAGSWSAWGDAWSSLVSGVDKTGATTGYPLFGGSALQSSSSVYIALEFCAIAIAVVGTVWLFRKAPGVALFGLGVFVLSVGSMANGTQGMDRYVLAVPAIFLMLASFGRRVVFDRAWVMASTLLMGMLAMLFTFGFWVS